MAKITIFLALLSTLALLAAAQENNVLLTGDVLETERALYTPDATFVLNGCNLVLYTPSGLVFQSNTSRGYGIKCRLTLNDVGQLVISGTVFPGSTVWRTVWSSPTSGNIKGNYAAVLRPDNVVAIYGPMVWAVPYTPNYNRFSGAHPSRSLSTAANNLMFSDETLRSESQLVAGGYSRFLMQSDCNLVLFHAGSVVWSTNTRWNGVNCFARLGYDGELAVADYLNRIVWSSNSKSTAGDYVLVLQTNGQAAVYGPIVWSTATDRVLLPGFSVA